MFEKIVTNSPPHRIENNIDPLATGKFGCRDEVCIRSYEYDSTHEPFVGERRDVEANTHVDALLCQIVGNVVFRQVADGDAFREQVFRRPWKYFPVAVSKAAKA